MRIDRFIAQRRPAWERLEQIANRLRRRGGRAGGAHDIEQLLHLYQQVTADLASLRTMEADPELIRWVNRLVVRVHAIIYQGRGGRRRGSVRRFIAVTYPRLFRSAWPQMLASFLICAVVYVLAFDAVREDPLLIADILGGGDSEFVGSKTPADIAERFHDIERTGTSPLATSLITTNNIKVALAAFALGVTLGIGTVYILAVNAAMLGGIAGAFARSGIESSFWSTVLPHGALELSAIVMAGGAGLVMGWAIWHPGDRTRRRALQEEATRAVLLVVGLIPAFMIAGFIEGYLTPSTVIPQWLKLAVGVAVAAVFWAYLLIAGREVEQPAAAADGWRRGGEAPAEP